MKEEEVWRTKKSPKDEMLTKWDGKERDRVLLLRRCNKTIIRQTWKKKEEERDKRKVRRSGGPS